ncbi:MAG: DUF3623 family protein, partial [Gammaproteobacteria bacterium]|nr:DUF3623 family protein [Gammaproteobacteria bacterium]
MARGPRPRQEARSRVSAVAIALTVALWWGSTGLIALLVRGGPRTFPALLGGASVVAVLGLAVLVAVRD